MYKIVNNGREAEHLEIHLGEKRKIPSDVSQFQDVQSVKIVDSCVTDVTNLGLLNNLNCVQLERCTSSKIPTGITTLSKIKILGFSNCNNLKEIDGLESLTNLTQLHFHYNENLKRIQGLKDLNNLKDLHIYGSWKLQAIHELDKLINLEKFKIGECSKVDLSKMNGLEKLKDFDFWGYIYLDFNVLKDLIIKGVYFHAEDDWRHAKPNIDLSEAYSSVFADNDKQFVDYIDSEKANAIFRKYFMDNISTSVTL